MKLPVVWMSPPLRRGGIHTMQVVSLLEISLVDRSQSRHQVYRDVVIRLRGTLVNAEQILIIHEVQEDDYARLLALMEQYRDRLMDLADAPIALVAEKIGYRGILTLDSDFLFYRINDRESFEVIQVE